MREAEDAGSGGEAVELDFHVLQAWADELATLRSVLSDNPMFRPGAVTWSNSESLPAIQALADRTGRAMEQSAAALAAVDDMIAALHDGTAAIARSYPGADWNAKVTVEDVLRIGYSRGT